MISFSLESGLGDSIPLTSHGAETLGSVILGSETEGFGFAQVETRFVSGAGVGARVAASRVGEQEGILHLIIRGTDRNARQARLREISDLIRFRRDRPLPLVVARYADGSEVERAFVMTGGGARIYDGAGNTSGVMLEVTSPHPYWRARRPFRFDARVTGTGPFLPELEKMQVVGTDAESERIVTNPGQVDAPVSWTLEGPSSGPTTVLINGRGWEFGPSLETGEVITVTVSSEGVTCFDGEGNDRFADFSGVPRFPWLPPGDSEVVMKMEGAEPGRPEPLPGTERWNYFPTPKFGKAAEQYAELMEPGTKFQAPNGHPARFSIPRSNTPELVTEYGVLFKFPIPPREEEIEVTFSGIVTRGQSSLEEWPAFFVRCGGFSEDGGGTGGLDVIYSGVVPVGIPTQVVADRKVRIAPSDEAIFLLFSTMDNGPWGHYFDLQEFGLLVGTDRWFSGDSPGANWQGTPGNSVSFAQEKVLVGQSAVTGFIFPEYEVVH